jgi:hypothetical protein
VDNDDEMMMMELLLQHEVDAAADQEHRMMVSLLSFDTDSCSTFSVSLVVRGLARR